MKLYVFQIAMSEVLNLQNLFLAFLVDPGQPAFLGRSSCRLASLNHDTDGWTHALSNSSMSHTHTP